MKRHVKMSIALLACVCAAIPLHAVHASVEKPELPQLPSAAMSIPWSDFRELLKQIEPAPVPEKEQPPAEWTVSKGGYEAELVADNTVRIRARINVVVWKPSGWVTIPVLGDTVAPVSATLDGEDVSLAAGDDGWFRLMLEGPGVHEFETTFFVKCTYDNGRAAFEFPCVRSPLTSMELRLPTRDARIHAPLAASISVERADSSLVADMAFRTTNTVGVNWTLPALAQKPKPVQEARLTCLTSTLASVTERYITCQSRLHYSVLRGSIDTFGVRLPLSVNVLSVTGQGAEWSKTESDDTQRIEVSVNHRVTDNYDLTLRYEAPFENEIATVKVPEIVVEDVVRETGYVGVAARGSVELGTGPEIAGLTRVDISDLPAAVRAMSPSPILLAFKYTDHPYLLAVDVRKLEDVPVRVASIDRAELTTVLTEEGMAITRAAYEVRNNVKQFLRIDVEENAEIWGAEVGGQVVKPARDGESNTVLVPLFKSAETNRRLGSFLVELVYMHRVDGMPRVAGRLDLRAPATDILVNEFYWEVLTPDSVEVFRSAGDLKPIERDYTRQPQLARQVTGTRRESVRRLRERIERFMITDINNPAASAAAAGQPRYTGEPLTETKQQAGPASISVAGVLPIRIELPAEGIAHQFRRLIVPQGATLKLSLYTYSSHVRSATKSILVVLAILLGFSVARLVWVVLQGRTPALRAVAMTAGLLVLLVVLCTAVSAAARPAVLAAVVCLVVTLLITWIKARTDARTAITG